MIKTKKTLGRDRGMMILALITGLLCWGLLTLTDNAISDKGAIFLAVFVVTLILWSTVDIGWPTILGMALLVIFGVVNHSAPFNVVFGSSITVTMIGMALVTGVMQKSGLVSYFSRWCLSRKIVHGRPFVFLLMYCFSLWVLGSFASFALIGYLMTGFIDGICKSCGYEKGSKFELALLCLTLWIGCPMCGILPMAHPSTLPVIALVEGAGFKINYLSWLKISLPFGLMMTAAALCIVRFVIRPDFSKFKNYDDEKVRTALEGEKLSFGAKLSLACVVLIVSSWVIPSLELGALSEYFESWGSTTACMLAFVALTVIPGKDNKPVIEFKEAMSSLPWAVVIMTGGITFFASYFGQESFGIQAAMESVIKPLLSNAAPITAILFGAVLAGFASQFMSNIVTSAAVVMVVVNILSGFEISSTHMHLLAVGVWTLSNCDCCTLAAAPAVGVIFNPDSIPLKGTVKYHIMAVSAFCVIFVVYALMVFR